METDKGFRNRVQIVAEKITKRQWQMPPLIKDLERKVVNSQKQFGKVDAPKAATLRKDRNVVFKQVDMLEVKTLLGEPDGKNPSTVGIWYYASLTIFFDPAGIVMDIHQ